MEFLSKIFKPKSAAVSDSQRIYQSLMTQSRQTVFFGQGRISDNYDGRIDVLTLHIACILKALYQHGEQGERLGQALFDRMKDDFEVALREEGISDTGVAKRIKPMISYFYTRVKAYTEGLEQSDSRNDMSPLSKAFETIAGMEDNPLTPEFKAGIMQYLKQLCYELERKSLGQIALCEFIYPEFAI